MKNSADQGRWYPHMHGGRRPRWITSSEMCRSFHILRKPNSIIDLLFIQNISPFYRSFAISLFLFPLTKKKLSQSRPLVFSFIGSINLLWRHRFNNLQRATFFTSLVQYMTKFFPHLVNSSWINACGFNQSETGKYVEWIINFLSSNHLTSTSRLMQILHFCWLCY